MAPLCSKAVISFASWRNGRTLPLVWMFFQRHYFHCGISRFEMPLAFFVLIEKAFSSQTLALS